jgi:hypothetical protein
MKFQTLQGTLTVDHGNLKLLPSKIKTATRIYDLDGTVSLNDKQARLSVGSGTAQWKVTGALEKPNVSGRPLAAQAASAHTQ